MFVMIYKYPPEYLNVPTLHGVRSGWYEIFVPELVIFGYGFRVNWQDEWLYGIAFTNKPFPQEEDQPAVEQKKYEQLKLPFEED